MNFYKITNEEEKHNNLQYKTGLNVDPIEFNPSGDCEPGGIYFSSEDIFAFLDYGPWIRKVVIPKDSHVYENPGFPKKWKTDIVILEERKKIDLEVIKKLVEEGANVRVDYDHALRWAVKNGHYLFLLLCIYLNRLFSLYMIEY
jgi:hypothetical protein